jgi:hypothetical protein
LCKRLLHQRIRVYLAVAVGRLRGRRGAAVVSLPPLRAPLAARACASSASAQAAGHHNKMTKRNAPAARGGRGWALHRCAAIQLLQQLAAYL